MPDHPAQAMRPLVAANWLAPQLKAPDLVILDCSWYLPSAGRDPELEYRAGHIPGALRFDLDQVSATDSDLPHMLPTPEQFAAQMELLGIHQGDRVVCYDGSGVNLSAARVWWTFRVFGHRAVTVLDGGFPTWASVTRPVQRGVVHRIRSGYRVPEVDPSLVKSMADVECIVAGEVDGQIVDCRSTARWRGEIGEPRPGLRRGHVQGSVNLPYDALTDQATGLMHSPDALRQLLRDAGLDPTRPIVAMCGSGTSAAALALAVEVLRSDDPASVGPPVAIYDGSWAEYGRVA